ncbi:hypothetical protein [Streptomyces sp. NPDC000410]|uniref:hypothetical protein n=1 Tax=Streptomyces sp. NPDC000410 TaxID=3154254 RepID=UPI003325849F
MNQDHAPQLCTSHEDWWKAPLMTSLPGVPLLVWEYSLFQADGYTSGIEVAIFLAMGLLVIAWVLPHRRSLRGLRIATAVTALGFALLPLVFAVLLAAAMSAG